MTCTFHFIARKNTSGQRFFRRINSTPTSSWLVTRSTCCKILTTELSTARRVDRNATIQTAGQQVATQLESACASCKRILVTHTMMHILPRGQELTRVTPRFCSLPIWRLKRNVCRWRELKFPEPNPSWREIHLQMHIFPGWCGDPGPALLSCFSRHGLIVSSLSLQLWDDATELACLMAHFKNHWVLINYYLLLLKPLSSSA